MTYVPKKVIEKEYIADNDELIITDRAHKNKYVRGIINNINNAEELKKQIIQKTTANLGFNFLTNYGIPKDFVLPSKKELENTFKKVQSQKNAMPFDEEQFKSFRNMKKTPWQNPIIIKVQKSICYNQLMTGYDKTTNQLCLFRFMLMQNPEDYEDFSLKLEMCVGGKEWLPLIRYDAQQESMHKNYIDKNGNFVEHGYDVDSPHFHITTEAGQVVFHDDLQTSFAQFADKINKKLLTSEVDKDTHLKEAVDMFKEHCAVTARIENYEVSDTNTLFNYNDIVYEDDLEFLAFSYQEKLNIGMEE